MSEHNLKQKLKYGNCFEQPLLSCYAYYGMSEAAKETLRKNCRYLYLETHKDMLNRCSTRIVIRE